MSAMSNVILGILGAIALALYLLRRRSRLRAEDGDNF